MKRNFLLLAAVAALGIVAGGASANTVVVNSFAATDGTAGTWGFNSVVGSATASIVANAPPTVPGGFGPGAALLTTTDTTADKVVVGVTNNYGTVSAIINNINLAYSYYKQPNVSPDPDPAAAPSLKLTFDNSTTGDKTTLVYEPYWNNGTETVTADEWLTDSITGTTGKFWTTGGFGQPSGAGGPPLETLDQWISSFDSTSAGAFSDATLTEVQIGEGSYNAGQNGYFDGVQIDGTAIADTTYNFEPASVPLPASAWSGLALLGGLGLLGAVKRHRRQMA